MTIMKKPRKCYPCRLARRGGIMEHVVLPTYTTQLEHDNCQYHITVKNIPMCRCNVCGELQTPDTSFDLIVDEMRRMANLLTPDEVKAGREKLGLSEEEFGDIFNIGKATVERWERGGQIFNRATSDLMRVMFTLPETVAVLQNIRSSQWKAKEESSVDSAISQTNT